MRSVCRSRGSAGLTQTADEKSFPSLSDHQRLSLKKCHQALYNVARVNSQIQGSRPTQGLVRTPCFAIHWSDIIFCSGFIPLATTAGLSALWPDGGQSGKELLTQGRLGSCKRPAMSGAGFQPLLSCAGKWTQAVTELTLVLWPGLGWCAPLALIRVCAGTFVCDPTSGR